MHWACFILRSRSTVAKPTARYALVSSPCETSLAKGLIGKDFFPPEDSVELSVNEGNESAFLTVDCFDRDFVCPLCLNRLPAEWMTLSS